eukprot:scaffold1953_cov176-Amphora_coffeaeformis.AAC.45
MPFFDPFVDSTAIGTRSSHRLRVATRVLAKRLQETKASAVNTLPPSCDRDSNSLDFCCLANGRVVCSTTEGAYVLGVQHGNSNNSHQPDGQSDPQRQWDFLRCPINHYGIHHVHPLALSPGFAVGLGSGDYYYVGTDARPISSTVTLHRRPKRRYEATNVVALGRQWNRTTPMNDLVELHNWREGHPLTVSDWDFFETGSSLLALQAGSDYMGLHDHRIQKGHEKGKQQICVYRGRDIDRNETFTRCCFVSEHIVATTSRTLMDPVRLWDLRNTRQSTGSILSFPVDKSAADLNAWFLANETNSLSANGKFGRDYFPSVSKLQRLDDDGNLLLTCQHYDEKRSNPGPITSNLLVDPMRESIKCISSHQQLPGMLSSSCLVSLPSSTFALPHSLLASPVQPDLVELVDIHGASSSSLPVGPSGKRRKTMSSACPFSKTGSVIGKFRPDIRDEYGLPSQLVRLAWDAKGCRLVGLSQDFDVFAWQL